MRRECLDEGWRIDGRIPGAGQADVQAEASLPFRLDSLEPDCGREGLFLHGWELSRTVTRPQEPAHSHAERTLLELDGVLGEGVLLVDGEEKGPLRRRMEVDLSEEMRQGECHVALRFLPHLPQLYPGERGRVLPVETAVRQAHVRNVYLMRIEEIEVEEDRVRVRVHAYGGGKVRVCFRLMAGEKLLWSENLTTFVRVGGQEIERVFAAPACRFAVMRVTIDMGGEGCDAAEAPYVRLPGTPRVFAHFRALPTEEMLRGVKQAGCDGVVMHVFADNALRWACARLGLALRQEGPQMRAQVLLRADAEPAQGGECLLAPVLRESPGAEFSQAEKLCRACARLRAAGEEIHLLALGRQSDAQDGLFDAQGAPRQALYALRGVLGAVSAAAVGGRGPYSPMAEFEEEIGLFAKAPDGGAAVVCAALYAWDGTLIAERSFAMALSAPQQSAGTLRARLPWELGGGLVMRVQCWRAGTLIAQSHAYYPLADENGKKQPFPLADVTEGTEGGQRVVYNASQTVAAGVTVLCGGKPVLRHAALLPQERAELARQGEIVVEYGNPIEKGGASIASQRILRGVFPAANPEAPHSQAGNR